MDKLLKIFSIALSKFQLTTNQKNFYYFNLQLTSSFNFQLTTNDTIIPGIIMLPGILHRRYSIIYCSLLALLPTFNIEHHMLMIYDCMRG